MQKHNSALYAIELPFDTLNRWVEMESDTWLNSYVDGIDDDDLVNELYSLSAEDLLKFINTRLVDAEVHLDVLDLSSTVELSDIDLHLFELACMVICGWLAEIFERDNDNYAWCRAHVEHIWFCGMRWSHDYESGVILLRIESKDGKCIQLSS